jgi:asparagine synthase (glutamine-hydrolysing)
MPADEIFAGKIAAKYHFRHHEIEADPVMMEMLPKMVYHLDEPIGDPAAINTFLICQRARQNGIKVLLSGMGADELFFGYRRQHATLMAQTYQRLPAIFRRAAEALSNLLPVRLGGVGLKPIRWAKRFFAFAGLPLDQAYMRSYSYYDKSELQQLFNWQFNHEIESIYQEHQSIFYDKFKGDAVNQMCYTDILLFMNGLNLTYSDRASMAASVEIRVPFIDKKVVELAMQIPGIYKYRQHQGKYILKKAAEPFLPKEIVYRPKASFGAPIRSWIFGDLKEMVNDLLGSRQCRQRGIFNTQAIDRLIEKDRQGVADNAYQIYQLLTMELWFRTFID